MNIDGNYDGGRIYRDAFKKRIIMRKKTKKTRLLLL